MTNSRTETLKPPTLEKAPYHRDEMPDSVVGADGWSLFPDQVFVIAQGGLHMCVNGTFGASDKQRQSVNGLVVCADPEACEASMRVNMFNGTPLAVTFNEARDIAKAKPSVSVLWLQVDGKSIDYHWVR